MSRPSKSPGRGRPANSKMLPPTAARAFEKSDDDTQPRLTVRDFQESPRYKEEILHALMTSARIDDICKKLNVSRQVLLRVREADSDFNLAWIEAVELGNDALEDEAVRRAMDGVKKPVYQGGILVGHVQEYSDSLMSLLLKGRRREKYGDKATYVHTGPTGGPIPTTTVNIPHDLSGLNDDELAKLYREAVDPST